jgi:uracil-DNA glycosylase family 4
MCDWQILESTITACRRCPRLVAWREEVARVKRRAYRDDDYWGQPVPGFGNRDARVLIVGLAPGAHGANRTGRMFTGDSSGDFLYGALYRAGFADRPTSQHRGDGLTLHDAYISAACRCAPPDNQPAAEELAACLPFLAAEIALLRNIGIVVALGRIPGPCLPTTPPIPWAIVFRRW